MPASQILALTFTNKAADEMQRRVAELAPAAACGSARFIASGPCCCGGMPSSSDLQPNFTIYDTSDARQTIKRVIEAREINTLNYTPDRIAEAISAAKNKLITADQYEPRGGSMLSRVVAEVYPAYQERLLASSAVDFDDLLLHVAQLLYEHAEIRAELDERYRYVLVDEYQDTNRAQYVILRALSTDHPNLAVTGDPDQSIYGWRGADLNNILEFEHDYPNVKIVRLERNYRSTKRILRMADELIGHNLRRKKKELWTENDEGAPVRLDRLRRPGQGSGRHRRADSRGGRRRAAQAERLRDLLPRERAVAVAGKGAAGGRRAVPDGPRPGVLRPQGNQGCARLLPVGQQPARRHGVRADDQHAAPRHRPQDDRAAHRARVSLRHAAVGSGPRGAGRSRAFPKARPRRWPRMWRSSIALRPSCTATWKK